MRRETSRLLSPTCATGSGTGYGRHRRAPAGSGLQRRVLVRLAVAGHRVVAALPGSSARPWPNGIKLSWNWHAPEDDLGQGCQPGGFAWLAGLVPAPGPLGLAFVAAPGAGRDEVAVPGDLGGQVGGELVKERRGKSTRSR